MPCKTNIQVCYDAKQFGFNIYPMELMADGHDRFLRIFAIVRVLEGRQLAKMALLQACHGMSHQKYHVVR